jgi:hypothetical protein
VGQCVSSRNKVFLSISKGALLMDNLQDTRLELRNVGDVVGRNSVLSLNTRNDHLENRSSIVNGFVRDTEVKCHRRCRSRGFTAETSCGSPWKDLLYDSRQHGGVWLLRRRWRSCWMRLDRRLAASCFALFNLATRRALAGFFTTKRATTNDDLTIQPPIIHDIGADKFYVRSIRRSW